MARHKKTRKTRRRMRGGVFPFTRWDGSPWSGPAPGQTLELPPVGVPEAAAKAAAPIVDGTVGTPPQQAAAIGVTPAPPSASAGVLGAGRRRRRTRKHRRRH